MGNFAPPPLWGHLAMSEDSFGFHTGFPQCQVAIAFLAQSECLAIKHSLILGNTWAGGGKYGAEAKLPTICP
jgi:hypothetical protein